MQNERVPRPAYVLLSGILLIAAVLRFVQLDYAPSGGHGDVAWIGINALDWVDRGIWPFYVRELYAPEPFPVYLTGLLLPLTGISYLPQRIITAAMGVLFVAFLFPAAWWLADGKSPHFRAAAGLFAALAGAVSLHVVAINRLGMESPPFLTVLALLIWLTAKAWRRGGYVNWMLAGATLALAQYVFLPARLLPLVLALWIAHGWWSDRERIRTQWRGWLVMALVSFVFTLPALILFVTTPEAFSARADAGTAQTGGWIWQFDTTEYGGSLALMIQKIGLTLLALGIEWRGPYNVMNLPMLGPLFFAGFLIVVPVAIRNFRQITYGWPLLALPVMLLTDLISGAVLEVHALHQMGVLPFVYILSGLGLAHLWQFLRQRLTTPTAQYASLGAIALLALVPAYTRMSHYLNVVIPAQYADPQSSWSRAQTDVDLARFLVSRPDTAFLLPYSEYSRSDVAWMIAEGFRKRRSAINADGMLDIAAPPAELTIVFPTDPERPRHDGFPARFDARLWVLLHDGQVWLLPPFTNEALEDVLQIRDRMEPQVLRGSSQIDIAQLYPVSTPPDWFDQRQVVDYPIHAVFNNEIRLLGYTLPDVDLEPGSVTFISLFWQPLAAPTEDYEIFVQLWSDEQISIGGAHDFPYGGMYRTRIWNINEVVSTHHRVEVPADLAAGRYTLIAGLFRLLHNERLPVSGLSADPELRIARAADLRVMPSSEPITTARPEFSIRFDDLFEVRGLAVYVDDAIQTGSSWQGLPGSVITTNIVWETLKRPSADYSVFLHLSADETAPPVGQDDRLMGGPLPTGVWYPGDLVSDQLSLTIPDDTPAGTYDLLLGVYVWQTGERLNVEVAGETPSGGRVKLGQLTIEDAAENVTGRITNTD